LLDHIMRVDAALLLACGLPAASAMSTNPKDISWLPPSGRVSGVSTIIPHHPLMSAGHQVATSVTPLDTHYTPWAPHVAVTGGVRPGMGSALESLMLNSLLSSSSTTSTTTSSTTQKCMTMMAPMMMGGMGTGSPIEKMMMMQTLMGSTTSSTTPKLGDCMKDPKVLMLMVNSGVDGSRAPSSLGGLGGGTLPTSDMQHTLMMMQLAGLGQSSSSSTSNPNPVATLLMAKALGGHSWQSQPYTAATPVQYAVAAPQPKEVRVCTKLQLFCFLGPSVCT